MLSAGQFIVGAILKPNPERRLCSASRSRQTSGLSHANSKSGAVYLSHWVWRSRVLLAASLLGGKPLSALLLAVEKVEPSVQGEEKSEMAKGLLWISVAWFVAVTAVAAFAYSAASSGSMWGLIRPSDPGAALLCRFTPRDRRGRAGTDEAPAHADEHRPRWDR